MTESPPRRRILCIRPGLDPAATSSQKRASDAWVKALSQQADVHSVDDDFDLDAVCKRVRPDAIMLDAVGSTRPRSLSIAHARARPEIPRALYLNGEPDDAMRPLTMRMAEDLGVETVFVSGEADRQQMPELRHRRSYVVPHFIDETVFRDYGLPKTIPVSVFGDRPLSAREPWRAQFLTDLPRVFPAFIAKHPDDESHRLDPFAMDAQAFAQLLNQSHFSAADTGRLDVCSRRHLEIPAAGSVLIAPPSDALALYGFVDMENCLLGFGEELFKKIDLISRVPVEYQRIRDAGMALVHRRYAGNTWRPMLDWLDVRLGLKPGQIVQQVGCYGPFRGVTPTPSTPSVMTMQPEADTAMVGALRIARTAILSGETMQAAAAGLAGWADYGEPRFLLGLFALLNGDPIPAAMAIGQRAQALSAIDMNLGTLDPVETAWLLLIARLIDNADLEAAMRGQADTSPHLSLRRMLWLLDACGTEPGAGLTDRQPNDLLSMHWLGEEDFTTWCDLIRRIFMVSMSCPGAAAIANRLLTRAA